MNYPNKRSLRYFLPAMLLLLTTLLSVGCTKKPINSENNGKYQFRNKDSVTVVAPAQALDVQQLYDSLTYTPEFFLGTYSLPGGSKALDSALEGAEFITPPTTPELSVMSLPITVHTFRDLNEDGTYTYGMSLSFID